MDSSLSHWGWGLNALYWYQIFAVDSVVVKTQRIVLIASMEASLLIVGEPKSRIVQKHTFFAPERYTAGILYTDSLNSA